MINLENMKRRFFSHAPSGQLAFLYLPKIKNPSSVSHNDDPDMSKNARQPHLADRDTMILHTR